MFALPPLDVVAAQKGLWLSLCNIVWSGVHFLVVSLLTVLLNCETWRLCHCVTPNVAAFEQPSRTTFAASGYFEVVVSSRNDAITIHSGCLGLHQGLAHFSSLNSLMKTRERRSERTADRLILYRTQMQTKLPDIVPSNITCLCHGLSADITW